MKKYAIISDTSLDLIDDKAITVPFKISVDQREFVDNLDMDIDQFLQAVDDSKDVIKSACPSAGEYLEAMEGLGHVDGIFVLTISSQLSGSFNAANMAKTMYLEMHPDKKCQVIDTESASAGHVDIYLELRDLVKSDLEFDQIHGKILAYIQDVRTLFVLENLDHLIKNGRMAKPAGFVISRLNLRPIMRDNGHGKIELEEIARGEKSSLQKLANVIKKYSDKADRKRLVISHCRAEDKANFIKEKMEELELFTEIIIEATRGIAAGYAAHGGIIVGFFMGNRKVKA